MTTTVELLTGLPASGKSTYAKQRVAESGGRLRRVCMDDLRFMLDNGEFSLDRERVTLKMQDDIIVQAVRAGYDVIVDNTHINKRMPDRIRAALVPYDIEWKVTNFRDVPVEECVRRDLERQARGERNVGRDVIERMGRRINSWHLTEDWLKEYPKPEKYVSPGIFTTKAIICDLDGTLAIHQGRDPYDTARCGEDALDPDVALLLDNYFQRGVAVILVSGRDETFRPQTEAWLERWGVSYNFLYMRPVRDTRRDDIVKLEIFDLFIRNDFDVFLTLDDRNRVVTNTWRALGLKTWQVAEGNF